MAYITFIARDTYVGSYQLSDEITLGRAEDCDIFIPDVFVSRHHCRFERGDRRWMIVDLESANGIFFKGARVKHRVLHHEDILELGSIAFMFDESDMETPEASTAEPFGPGARIAQLVDTVFAHNARPSDYVRRRLKKLPVRKRASGAVDSDLDLAAVDAVVVITPEPDQWTELDVEIQLAAMEVQPQFILVPAGSAGLALSAAAEGALGAMGQSTLPGSAPVGRWSPNGPSPDPVTGLIPMAAAPSNGHAAAATANGRTASLWDQSNEPAEPVPEKKRKVRKPKVESDVELAPLRERLEAGFVYAREWLLESRMRLVGIGGGIAAIVLGVVLYQGFRDPYAGLRARAKERLANMTAQEKADYESASGN